MPQAPEMELQSRRTRPFLLYQQPNGIPSAAQTGCGSRGKNRCQLSLQVTFLHPAVHRCTRILLIKQKLFYGVWQRQRGNQMESVFAKSSSHGHTAQIQQGPGDTWNAVGRKGDRGREVNLWLAKTNSQNCRLPSVQWRAVPGEEGLVICSSRLRKE